MCDTCECVSFASKQTNVKKKFSLQLIPRNVLQNEAIYSVKSQQARIFIASLLMEKSLMQGTTVAHKHMVSHYSLFAATADCYFLRQLKSKVFSL